MPRVQNLRGRSLSSSQRAHLLTLPKKLDVKIPRDPTCLEGLLKGGEEGLDLLLD